MNIKKLEPIKLESQEEIAKIEKAVANQVISSAVPKVFDENFPLFRFETNQKHFVYIPNFTVVDEDGNKRLRVEAPHVHAVQTGRTFNQFRATHGLQGMEDYGISGQSPLQEAVSQGWEFYNLKLAQVAKSMGIDPNNDPADALKQQRSNILNERPVKDAQIRYYFPIVVFECENDTKTGDRTTKPIFKDGKPVYQIMWADVSENQWKENWVKAMDSLEDGDTLAGKYVVLNYRFTDNKDELAGNNARRDSGKALNISIRPQSDESWIKLASYLDEEAKEWTPQKARETIIAAALLTDAQQQEIADESMHAMLLEFDALQKQQAGLGGGNQEQISAPESADDKLSAFGGEATDEGQKTQEANDGGGIQFGAQQ